MKHTNRPPGRHVGGPAQSTTATATEPPTHNTRGITSDLPRLFLSTAANTTITASSPHSQVQQLPRSHLQFAPDSHHPLHTALLHHLPLPLPPPPASANPGPTASAAGTRDSTPGSNSRSDPCDIRVVSRCGRRLFPLQLVSRTTECREEGKYRCYIVVSDGMRAGGGGETYTSRVKLIRNIVANLTIPARHAKEPAGVSACDRAKGEVHAPRLSRRVTRNRTPSVGRLRHVNTMGTANSAMSQKMPTPLWMKTMRREEARRMHLRGTTVRSQSALCVEWVSGWRSEKDEGLTRRDDIERRK